MSRLGIFFAFLILVTILVTLYITTFSFRDEPAKLQVTPNVNGKNIFFIETRQATDHNEPLTPRQACAIESAATLNPDWKVFVLTLTNRNSEDDLFFARVWSLLNVHIMKINLGEFSNKTPTGKLFRNGLKTKPEWLVAHTSDILRYTTLYRYAGVYMDLDMILMTSLNGLPANFAGQQVDTSELNIGAGIIGFGADEVGRSLVGTIVDDLGENFRGEFWDESSVGVLTKAIRNICGTNLVANATQEQCKGFKLYPPESFYSIPWTDEGKDMFFKEDLYEQGMAELNSSLGTHLWNALTANRVSERGKTVLCDIGESYCPAIMGMDTRYCL